MRTLRTCQFELPPDTQYQEMEPDLMLSLPERGPLIHDMREAGLPGWSTLAVIDMQPSVRPDDSSSSAEWLVLQPTHNPDATANGRLAGNHRFAIISGYQVVNMLIDHRKGRPTPYVVPETTQEPPELVLADTLYLFPGESAVMGRNYNTPPGRALCEFGAIYQKVAENHLWAMNNAGKLALQHLMTDARYRTQVVHR